MSRLRSFSTLSVALDRCSVSLCFSNKVSTFMKEVKKEEGEKVLRRKKRRREEQEKKETEAGIVLNL